jgi:hypothetical protein
MSHAEFISWASEGHKDAMGRRFSNWLVARYQDDGRVMRDDHNRVVYETQAEWSTRYGAATNHPAKTVQGDLFSGSAH